MADLIGRDIGRYHIVEQLGHGGMAIVYKAYDSGLKREVAIKVIRSELFETASIERTLKQFEHEAQILAQLTHPNIVKILDYGTYENTPYLVLEYLPGGTLREQMGEPMAYMQAARLLAPIAHSIEFAHQHHIIHRDIKPSNIIMDENGEPRLTDFGIAKAFSLEKTMDNPASSISGMLGTPEYMAPEQVLGQPVGPKADIYSLGVVFYELVCGHKLFSADTPLLTAAQHIHQTIKRPRDYIPDLPGSVEGIIYKAIAKQPEKRFSSMAAFADALEKLAREMDPGVRKDWRSGKGSIKDHLFSLGMPGLIAGIAVLVLAAGLLFMPKNQANIIPPRANSGSETPTFTLHPTDTIPAALAQLPGNMATPSSTATPIPSVTPTSLPPVINAQNGSNIQERYHLGEGEITGMAVSDDQNFIVFSSARGVRVLDFHSLQLIQSLNTNSAATAVAISPREEYTASAMIDGRILLWKRSNNNRGVSFEGTPLVINGHQGTANALDFSPDAKWLASGGDDNNVIIWSLPEGKEFKTLHGHYKSVISLKFSPDSLSLVSGGRDMTARIWDINKGFTTQILRANANFGFVAFSPDGQQVALFNNDVLSKYERLPRIYIRSVKDGSLLKQLDDQIPCFAYPSDGNSLQTILNSGIMKQWRMPDSKLQLGNPFALIDNNNNKNSMPLDIVVTYPFYDFDSSNPRTTCLFSPDRQKLVFSSDNNIIVLDINSGNPDRTYSNPILLGDIEQSQEGKFLAAKMQSTVSLLQIPDLQLMRAFDFKPVFNNSSAQLAVTKKGQYLAVSAVSAGFGDEQMVVWDTKNGSILSKTQGGSDVLAFSPDGNTLLNGVRDLILWRTANWAQIKKVPGFFFDGVSWVYSQPQIVFSPDSKMVYFDSQGFQFPDMSAYYPWEIPTAPKTCAPGVRIFSPDGSLFAFACSKIDLFDVSNKRPIKEWDSGSQTISSIAFSPDNQLLATGDVGGTIQVWNLADTKAVVTLKAHIGPVNFLDFSADGRYILSSSTIYMINDGTSYPGDSTIRTWGIP